MVKNFIDQFCNLSDLVVTLEASGEVKQLSLPVETVLQLTRIVQESLSNTRKHAGASSAHVRMAINNSTLQIDVSDDGQGFDYDTAVGMTDGGFGLTTMQDRAESIGANLEVSSHYGTGTTIAVQYPLDDDRIED